jgi:hypothetical protein
MKKEVMVQETKCSFKDHIESALIDIKEVQDNLLSGEAGPLLMSGQLDQAVYVLEELLEKIG